MFMNRLSTHGKMTLNCQKKCAWMTPKWKPSLWFTIGHFMTQTNRKWWSETSCFRSRPIENTWKTWGQCQWRGLQSGSNEATVHHHHYHSAASMTGHGSAADRSDAYRSSHFGNLDPALTKWHNYVFTISTIDTTTEDGQWSRHPGLDNNQSSSSSSVHWWGFRGEASGWW